MREMFRTHRRTLIYLIVSNLLLIFGFRVWQATFNNFAVETLHIGPEVIGGIQSLRELPGLLTFLVGFLALVLSEVRIMAFSVMVLGIGIIITGQATALPLLLIGTVVMSFGFHFFGPSQTGIILMQVDKERAPKFLGQLKSIGAVGAIVATGAVYFLADRLGYRGMFFITGALMVAGGIVLFFMGKGRHGLPPKRRVVLRKKYWVFYSLAFLMGSRRHIFTTFAIFLLVSKFGISVKTTAILFLVNNLINTYAYQYIGKLVSRVGERLVLTLSSIILIPIFLGYAYVGILPLLYVLFVLDNILFGVNMAVTTYLQKISDSQEEITSNLSLQTTINHISAVIVPVIGGTVWVAFGAQAPFLFGVIIVILTLALAQFMRVPGTVG
ncbi:MAG TPA: MFS transporter [Candidatus Acetothermia bacterium]|nr:MFS transporter [Candidatus Acetothermia bacterium]HEX32135.1 MFS transporter [Candidatus Acetothermia bacterium]